MVGRCIRLGMAADVVAQAGVRPAGPVCHLAQHLRRRAHCPADPSRPAPVGLGRVLGLPGLAPFQPAAHAADAGEPARGQPARTPGCAPTCDRQWRVRARAAAGRHLHGLRTGTGGRLHRRGVPVRAVRAAVRLVARGVGHGARRHPGLGPARAQPGVLAVGHVDRAVLHRRRFRTVLEPAHRDGGLGRGDRVPAPARPPAAGRTAARACAGAGMAGHAVACPAGRRRCAPAGAAAGRRRGRGREGHARRRAAHGHVCQRSGQYRGRHFRQR